MSNNIVQLDYSFLQKTSEIEQLCLPIKDQLGITYFNYVRLNRDNSRFLLTNKAKYVENFYKYKRYHDKTVMNIECLKYNKVFMWEAIKNAPTFKEARNDYDIANGITLIETSDDYYELYYFGTTANNKKDYLSHIDWFERFIMFFKDRGNDLIHFACQHPMVLPETKHYISTDNATKEEFRTLTNSDYFRFIYDAEESNYIFSQRETEFASYLLMQFSAREIARKMQLSNKTVEAHIAKLKEKLGCYSKQSLIEILFKLDIVNINLPYKNDSINLNKKNCTDFGKFLFNTNCNKIYIDAVKDVYVTKKESECLFYFCHGYNAKKISKMFNCSYRTIEQHIYNVSKKLRCSKKSQLVNFCIRKNVLQKFKIMCPYLNKSKFDSFFEKTS
jgi:DNA-binding CsgD family transcriptional regulator